MSMIITTPLGPTLETERLFLRPPVKEDFDDFAAMHADPEVMQFLGGTQPKAVAWRTFNALAGSWHLWGFSMFCLIDKESGEWLGRVGPIYPYGWAGYEVGWGLKKAAQGKGFAREAAVAAMDYAFDILGWDKLIHCIHPDNVPSQNIALRLGSENLGRVELPAPYENLVVDAWGQNRAEWRINRRQFV